MFELNVSENSAESTESDELSSNVEKELLMPVLSADVGRREREELEGPDIPVCSFPHLKVVPAPRGSILDVAATCSGAATELADEEMGGGGEEVCTPFPLSGPWKVVDTT